MQTLKKTNAQSMPNAITTLTRAVLMEGWWRADSSSYSVWGWMGGTPRMGCEKYTCLVSKARPAKAPGLTKQLTLSQGSAWQQQPLNRVSLLRDGVKYLKTTVKWPRKLLQELDMLKMLDKLKSLASLQKTMHHYHLFGILCCFQAPPTSLIMAFIP